MHCMVMGLFTAFFFLLLKFHPYFSILLCVLCTLLLITRLLTQYYVYNHNVFTFHFTPRLMRHNQRQFSIFFCCLFVCSRSHRWNWSFFFISRLFKFLSLFKMIESVIFLLFAKKWLLMGKFVWIEKVSITFWYCFFLF